MSRLVNLTRAGLFQLNHRVRNNDGRHTAAVSCCTTVMMAPAAQRKERTTANGRISIHHGTERLGTAQMDVMGSVKSIRSGRVGDRSAPASLARLPDRQPMCITYHVPRITYHVSRRHIYDMTGHQRYRPSVLALRW